MDTDWILYNIKKLIFRGKIMVWQLGLKRGVLVF